MPFDHRAGSPNLGTTSTTAASARSRRVDRAGDFVGYHLTQLVWSVIALAAALAFYLLYSPPRSQSAVAHDFIRDLNSRSISGLQSDLRFDTGSGLKKGDHASVVNVLRNAKLPWKVFGVTIEGTTPSVSSAYVTGTAAGTFLTVNVPLFKEHNRWYVVLANPNDPQPSSN